jgi:hypothetical protein
VGVHREANVRTIPDSNAPSRPRWGPQLVTKMPPYLTLTEAAEMFRADPRTVRRHARDLGGWKLGGSWRFPNPLVFGPHVGRQTEEGLSLSPNARALALTR